ncbi:MAG: DMT family transporter [Desulfitobacteriaceae bacterium]|nr:DMT family transporter [Desulfitobacteriaceae bacterium]MDD4752911.1 DMT family transporter [Desulfitobacteriaceae bacterium]
MNNYLKGIIMVLISAFGFALMPSLALFAYQSEITVLTLLFFRFFLASILFFLYLYFKPEKVSLNKITLLKLFLIGAVIYNMQSIFYFSSVKYIAPSLAVLILYTHPVIIAVASSFLDHEPLTMKLIISVLVSFLGMALMLGTNFSGINGLGVLFAAGTSVVYAAYVILTNKILKTVPPLTASAYISLFASVGLLMVSLLSGSFSLSFQASVWPWLITLVIFSTVIALLTFYRGLEVLGPTKATILSMAEPLFGIFLAILLFQDHLSLLQMIGAAGVISGAVAVVYKREKLTGTE